MVHVAKEMQRQDYFLPLMIGGATTSRAHTALKIEPNYQNDQVIHVTDASRAVGVAQQLLTPDTKAAYIAAIREDYEQVRQRRSKSANVRKSVSLAAARENRLTIDWTNYQPPQPKTMGVQVFKDYSLEELRARIDWTPFFIAWELAGKYPRILNDGIVGEQARQLHADAEQMLDKIIDEKWLTANAVIGFYPANSDGDDIQLYTNDSRSKVLTTLHHLRQQDQKKGNQPNYCLSDYVAPVGLDIPDFIGAFACTAGGDIERKLAEFEADHDDYQSIMLKVLADRLAEAFAEQLHERVRTEFWAYAADESLDNEDLIKERYAGIRPAPGYPACPDHTEKATLWELLEPNQNAGISITESFAMLPTAAVSGWYFSHPNSRYFAVARLQNDQVADYAKRKDLPKDAVERWLGSVIES
jgi:5-methyltetrahydrofolate--homocysteine methyltransferase